ncbi:hypothetical protein M0R45_015047 [Rubus argutus]|uniref:C2H2-type domain-containing protein n=1 Tax=Rubus argutus TaxID=59490 RepID=A0AAW1XPD0_RUBAR
MAPLPCRQSVPFLGSPTPPSIPPSESSIKLQSSFNQVALVSCFMTSLLLKRICDCGITFNQSHSINIRASQHRSTHHQITHSQPGIIHPPPFPSNLFNPSITTSLAIPFSAPNHHGINITTNTSPSAPLPKPCTLP